MPKQSTQKFSSTTEARCPVCGVTLSRIADLTRHMSARHPDGTEVKYVRDMPLNILTAHGLSIGSIVRMPAARTGPISKAT